MNEENLNNENVETESTEVNTQPSEPVESVTSEPVQEPVEQVVQEQSVQSEQPVVQEQPIQSEQPIITETTEVPTEPVAPVEPVAAEPIAPVVETPAEPVVQPTPVEPTAPVEPVPTEPVAPKKSSCLPIIIVCLVGLLLVVCGIVAYFIFGKGIQGGGNNNPTTTTAAKSENDKYVEKMISNRIISIDKTALQSRKLQKPEAFEPTAFTLNGTTHNLYNTCMEICTTNGCEKSGCEVNLDGLYLIAKSNGKINQMFTIKDNNGKEYEVLLISEDEKLTTLTIIDGENNAIFRTLEPNCSLTEEAYDGKFIKVENNTVYVKIHRGFDAGGMTGHSLEVKIKVVDGNIVLEAGDLTDWLGSQYCPR